MFFFPADDECGTAPFLKRSECSGSNCDGLLKGKWHKIKCFPFSLSVHRSLCSKWCHEGETSTQSWYGAFQNFSLDRIYCKNGDRQLIFEVVHCRSFEFIVKSMAPGKCLVDTIIVWSYHHHHHHHHHHYYYHHYYHYHYYYQNPAKFFGDRNPFMLIAYGDAMGKKGLKNLNFVRI